jgi:predicted Co/Zn/Cd cation transporter (cation efflux family)
MFIGTWYSGYVVDQHKNGTGHAWTNIWLTPAAIAGAVLIAFIIGFKEKNAQASDVKEVANA